MKRVEIRKAAERRGMALLIVLVALGLASALGLSLLKLTMAQRRPPVVRSRRAEIVDRSESD